MIRVTATMLETFRRYQQNEYMTYDELVASLAGKSQPNEAMLFGSAVHTMLERAANWFWALQEPATELDYTAGGFVFDRQSVTEALWKTNEPFFPEVPNHKTYTLVDGRTWHGAEVRLRCKADAVLGRNVVDYKITQNTISDTKINGYLDSMQWRAYLEVFGADVFGYSLQQWKERDGVWHLADKQLVTATRYSGLTQDVRSAVEELYWFCAANNIEHVLHKEDEAYA